MEERVQLTPLIGAHEEGPVSYLLEVDQAKILLDCGWNEDFDPKLLEPLRKVFPQVNIILISFGDLEHMGALPYCIRNFGLNAKIYATAPSKELGLRALFEAYMYRAKVGEFEAFDLDDINNLEDHIEETRFEMNLTIKGLSVNPISIQALGAGRLLGGCMWHIVREPDSILYAIDFSVGKDTLLDGVIRKCEKLNPTLLITDSNNYMVSSRESVNRRKAALCNRVLEALRHGRNKNVIMPVDSAGRVLELLYILNAYWKQNKLGIYPIMWLSLVGTGVLSVARLNVVDYMNSDVNSAMSRTRKNPFDQLENVQIVSSIEQIEAHKGPKVILAASSSMEHGPVQELLRRYGPQDGHLFLLTDKTLMPNSLARSMVHRLEQRAGGAGASLTNVRLGSVPVDLRLSEWRYFTGRELKEWKQRRKEEARERRLAQQNQALSQDMAMDGMDVMDEKERMDVEAAVADQATESAQQPGPLLQRRQSSMNAIDDAQTGGGLFSFFARQGEGMRTMFSAVEPERNKRWDEYGEMINVEDFLGGEEDPDDTGAGGVGAHTGLAAGQQGDSDSDFYSESSHSNISDDDQEVLGPEDVDENMQGQQHSQQRSQQYDDQSDDEVVIDDAAAVVKKNKKRKKKQYKGDPVEDAMLPRPQREALPRECKVDVKRYNIRCLFAYIDMESRANGVDSKMIVNMLKPRKVVVVHGSKQATAEMVDGLKQLAVQTVVDPAINESIDVSSDVGMWRLELDRGLFDENDHLFSAPKTVHFPPSKKRKGGETVGIRYIEGIVEEGEDQLNVIRPIVPAENETLARSVEPRFIHAHITRLEVYRRLQEHDEQEDLPEADRLQPRMEHGSGVIFCKDSVSVSAEDSGERLCVEGPISSTFYTVRKIVYQCYESV